MLHSFLSPIAPLEELMSLKTVASFTFLDRVFAATLRADQVVLVVDSGHVDFFVPQVQPAVN